MPSPELQRLFRLHETDEAIRIAKVRRAALDGGKAVIAELRKTKALMEAAEAASHDANAAENDARLERRGILEKADRLDAELYAGKVTSPREVEDRQKQIESLRKRAAEIETGDPARHESARARLAEATTLKERFEEERRAAQKEVKRQQLLSERIATALAELEPRRVAEAAGIEAPLLARYEDLKARHKGIGMARVSPTNTCGACGNAVPSRQMEALVAEKVVQCDACRRILYFSEGVV